MLVKFYDFPKRANSTKAPDDSTSYVEYECKLKERTSFYAPSFLTAIPYAILKGINYASFDDRFFFVTDIVSVANDLWRIECTMDYLATYKDTILNASAYVKYSASRYSDQVEDARYTAKATSAFTVASATLDGIDLQSGNFILTVINDVVLANSPTGFTTSYMLTPTSARMFSEAFLTNVDLLSGLFQSFDNPYQAIVSCIWVPFASSLYSDTITTLKLGTAEILSKAGTGIPCQFVTQSTFSSFKRLLIPFAYDDFRKREPWSIYRLYLPSYGLLNISADDLLGETQIGVEYRYDLLTGDIAYRVFKGSNLSYTIATATAKCGANIPLAQMRSDGLMTVIGGVAETFGGIATGNASQIAQGALKIGGGLLSRSYSTSGNLTGRAGFYIGKDILFSVESFDTQTNSLTQVIGSPLEQIAKLGELNGYVQTQDASVDIGASDTARSTINDLLNGGIYIE